MKDGGLKVSAARLLGTGQFLMDSLGFQLEPGDQELLSEYIATTRTQLGEQAFAKAWAEGQAMAMDEAVAHAQALPPPEQPGIEEHPPTPHHALPCLPRDNQRIR